MHWKGKEYKQGKAFVFKFKQQNIWSDYNKMRCTRDVQPTIAMLLPNHIYWSNTLLDEMSCINKVQYSLDMQVLYNKVYTNTEAEIMSKIMQDSNFIKA